MAFGVAMAHRQHAGGAAFFLTFGAVSALLFTFLLNWFLGLAPLFCVRDNVGAAEAMVRTADFCVARAGRLIGLSLGFQTVWIVWAGTMMMFLFAALSLAKYVAAGWVMLLMGLVALVYFAGADLLYLARLGAYVALAEEDDLGAAPPVRPPEETPAIGLPRNLEPA
jgi:hypothetical protein